MKALTIWQPWAGLIIHGVKRVENRTWKSSLKIGDRFAIHAGKDDGVAEWVEQEIYKLGSKMYWDNGVILGTVRLAGIITRADQLPPDQRKWFAGPVGWVLADARPWFMPPRCKGALGLWEIPQEVQVTE